MREELKQILADVLEVGFVRDSDSVDTVPNWDSVRHLTLVLAIEQRFGMTFEADEIPELISVQAIEAALSRHKRAAAG